MTLPVTPNHCFVNAIVPSNKLKIGGAIDKIISTFLVKRYYIYLVQ